MNQNNTETRLEQLESRLAWQDEMLETLNLSVVRLQETLQLQQDQLRFLYRKLQTLQDGNETFPSAHEPPPHY